jgi:hypothetical protein
MNTFANILMIVALLVVAGTLFAGLFNMARGGPGAAIRSNTFMRWRVIAQGFAVLLFVIAMAMRG